MPSLRRVALILLATCAVPGAGRALDVQLPPDALVQRILDERVEAGGATGLVVGLLDRDGTTRVFHAGSAGRGAPPLGPNSVFQIGSISKVLTGTLLADMVRRGEVSLHQPIEAYLPDGREPGPARPEAITLADLATHRAGLPAVPDDLPMADLSDPYADYTVDLLYSFLERHRGPPRDPARLEYSNVGVGLLGQLLAARLGLGWEEAVRRRVLEPLGMTMTRLDLDDEMRGGLARGHDLGGVEVPPWDFGALAPAAGLFSTAGDLLRFLAANVEEPRTGLQQAMRVAHHPRAGLGLERTVGLTWLIRAVGDRSIVWHGGATGGHRAFVGFDPDQGTGVVVLANSGPGIDDLGFHLLDPMLPLAPVALPAFAHREEGEVDPADLSRFVGEYFILPGAPLRIDASHGRLWVKLPGRAPLPAYSDGNGGLFLRSIAVEITLEEGASHDVAVIRDERRTVRARRIG